MVSWEWFSLMLLAIFSSTREGTSVFQNMTQQKSRIHSIWQVNCLHVAIKPWMPWTKNMNTGGRRLCALFTAAKPLLLTPCTVWRGVCNLICSLPVVLPEITRESRIETKDLLHKQVVRRLVFVQNKLINILNVFLKCDKCSSQLSKAQNDLLKLPQKAANPYI